MTRSALGSSEICEELNAALASCGVRSHLDLAKATVLFRLDLRHVSKSVFVNYYREESTLGT